MDRIHLLAGLLAAIVVILIFFSLFTHGRWMAETYTGLKNAEAPAAYAIEVFPVIEPMKAAPPLPPPKKQRRHGRSLEQILQDPLGGKS